MRAAILGAGSLGTCMGAFINTNGGDVELIDANREHVDTLNRHGATVIGNVDLKNVPVKAVTPDQMEGIYDLVIVLLKQTANVKALPGLLPHLDEDSIVCTLQNGIPEENVANIIGRERTISGVMGWGAQWEAPGVSRYTTGPEVMYIELGDMEGEMGLKVRKAADYLKMQGEVRINPNLTGIRWSKLVTNCALSGMSAVLGCTCGEVLDDDMAAACGVHVGQEVVRVATAMGIELPILVKGYDFYDLDFKNDAGRKRAVEWLRGYCNAQRGAKASMLQDMEKGIHCEIDFINGEACKYGSRNGIGTPFNDTLVRIIKEFEAGNAAFPTKANLNRFTIPNLS